MSVKVFSRNLEYIFVCLHHFVNLKMFFTEILHRNTDKLVKKVFLRHILNKQKKN